MTLRTFGYVAVLAAMAITYLIGPPPARRIGDRDLLARVRAGGW